MDETWLYHYDPETKQHSMEWQHSGSLHPKKFWVQKSAGKFLASIFWDQDSILLIDYLPKGQTIKAEYYSSLLVQVKAILKEKRRREVTKGVLFLHDNAPAHRALATHKKPAHLGFQCLDHPPYSPHLAPSDYHLFPWLKNNWKVLTYLMTMKHNKCCNQDSAFLVLILSNTMVFKALKRKLKGRHFSSDADVIAAAETWLDGQTSECFFEWLAKVRGRGQEVYWASWGGCWINPELVRCSLFPSWSG